MLIDFSTSSCGYCGEAAREFSKNPQFQALVSGVKCSLAVIIPIGDTTAWNAAVNQDPYAVSHSYAAKTQLWEPMELFLGRATGTPTYFLIDKQGNLVGELMEGGDPMNLLNQTCR